MNARALIVTGVAVALLFALGLPVPVHAGSPTMLHADETYNGRTVNLAVGESLEISLPENPTTGYVWQVPIAAKETIKDAAADDAKHAENSPCRYVKDFYEPGRTEVAGQGGIHHRQYVAVKSGTCQIDLVYRRVWEQDVAPKRTFRLQVEVRKGV